MSDQPDDRWQVTVYATGGGDEYKHVGDDMWQGPDGDPISGPDLDRAHYPLRVVAVDGVHALVCERDLLAEAVDRLRAEATVAAERDRLARMVFVTARQALLGAAVRCHRHGEEWVAGAMCCDRPRANARVLRALAEADPQPFG